MPENHKYRLKPRPPGENPSNEPPTTVMSTPGEISGLGLLAEEYDPRAKRFLGNFPQAFSHIGIINTAAHLARVEPASADRGADTAVRSS